MNTFLKLLIIILQFNLAYNFCVNASLIYLPNVKILSKVVEVFESNDHNFLSVLLTVIFLETFEYIHSCVFRKIE